METGSSSRGSHFAEEFKEAFKQRGSVNPLGDQLRASSRWWTTLLPGVGLTLAIAVVASTLGRWQPVIGGPVFGIVLGMLIRSTFSPPDRFRPGIGWSAKKLLQLSIILFGFSLSLREIVSTGAESLTVMLTTLALCLFAAWFFGRVLGISTDLTTLIGVGTAICGASAIAAVSPVVEAEEQDVAYAISTIFLFNVTAVLLFPPIGHALTMSQTSFGLWAGTAVNDTSSVVAAAYSFGEEAGLYATVVKLTRSTLIIPIALGLAAYKTWAATRQVTTTTRAPSATLGQSTSTREHSSQHGAAASRQGSIGTKTLTQASKRATQSNSSWHTAATTERVHQNGRVTRENGNQDQGEASSAPSPIKVSQLIPWFIVWFLAAALVSSSGLLPAAIVAQAASVAKFLIIVALSAVGLSANFRQMARTGMKPILLGFLLWCVVSVSSLIVQQLTGQLG